MTGTAFYLTGRQGKYFMRKIALCLTLFSVISCIQEKAAPVIYKGDKIYDRNYYKTNKYDTNAVYRKSPDGRVVKDVRKTNQINTYDSRDVEESRPIITASNTKTTSVVNLNTEEEKKNISENKSSPEILTSDTITIKSGDTLSEISAKYNISSKDLIEINNLKKPYNLYAGQKLKLPVSRVKYHTVSNGETLYGIAIKYDISSKDIIALNNLKEPYNLYVGQKLKLPDLILNYHVVSNGETLYGIAIKYDISSKDIIALNNLKEPYNLYVGQKLKLPVQKIQYHHVTEGESLYSIAKKYDINIASIVELNNLKEPYIIYPKQQLRLPSSMSGYSISKVVSEEAKEEAKKTIEKKEEPKTTTVKVTPVKTTSQNNDIDISKNKTNVFDWPVKGSILSKFGPKEGGLYNDGINIKSSEGTPFVSSEDGVVAYVGNELRGYGNLVIIKHSGNWISAYGHCASIKVERGDKVRKGQVLGTIGKTGNAKEPQLYFGLRQGRQAVNPERYLKK